jgi:hypothetical protein
MLIKVRNQHSERVEEQRPKPTDVHLQVENQDWQREVSHLDDGLMISESHDMKDLGLPSYANCCERPLPAFIRKQAFHSSLAGTQTS